jgi:hypothetical protein
MPKNHAHRAPSYPVGVLPVAEPPVVDELPAAPRARAPVAEWRAYAEALGVDTAGMSKAQIRAAL